MQIFQNVFSFFTEHKEVIGSAAMALLGVAKLTVWGRAHAIALQTVVAVIERVKADEVKKTVAANEKLLSSGAQIALQKAVANVDFKKPAEKLGKKILRALLPW